MKKALLILAIGMSIHVNGQTIKCFKVTTKHTLDMDSVLRTAEYDAWNSQITINYGIYRSMVPCESGYILYDFNDEKYLIKRNSVYYTRIEDSLKSMKNRTVINNNIQFH